MSLLACLHSVVVAKRLNKITRNKCHRSNCTVEYTIHYIEKAFLLTPRHALQIRLASEEKAQKTAKTYKDIIWIA